MLAVFRGPLGKIKKKKKAGRRRTPAVVELHESWWSGRSC